MALSVFPPPDPNHKYYLTTCYVCQELAKPGTEHIRNYGAIVCFSCRQFFRRAHQKTKQPSFNCAFGGNCAVTVKSRRRCQKCRYDRCLVAGMVPAAVLTDEEKTVRFRKFRQKRKARCMALGIDEGSRDETDQLMQEGDEGPGPRKRRGGLRDSADNSSDSCFSDNESDPMPPLQHLHPPQHQQRLLHLQEPPPLLPLSSCTSSKRPKIGHHKTHHSNHRQLHNNNHLLSFENVLMQSSSQTSYSTMTAQSHSYFGGSSRNKSTNSTATTPTNRRISSTTTSPSMLPIENQLQPWPKLMSAKIESIVQRYQLTLSQMQSDLQEELLLKLDAFQAGDISVRICKEEIVGHLLQVTKQFHHFALLQSQFTKLRKEDQKILLSRNTPLYIQLYISYFFGTIRATDLLKNNSSNNNFVNNISVRRHWYNPFSMVFKSGVDFNVYAMLFARLRELRLECEQVRAVLAYIVLFRYEPSLKFKEAFVLDDICILNEIMFLSCLKRGQSNLTCEGFISTLDEMMAFSSKHINWNDDDDSLAAFGAVISRLPINYNFLTVDERAWVANELLQMEIALVSVTRSEDILKEITAFYMGSPPTLSFILKTWRFYQLRIWKLLNTTKEFQTLPEPVRTLVWRRVAPIGVAFLTMLKECTDDGVDQLRDEFGGLSRERFEAIIRSQSANTGKLKKRWSTKNLIQYLDEGLRSYKLADVMESFSDPNSWEIVRLCPILRQKLQPLLRDPVLEKLFLLLSMTHDVRQYMPQLHQSCNHLIWRYLTHVGARKQADVYIQTLLHNQPSLRRFAYLQSSLSNVTLVIKVEPMC